jgi:hypothetical protein
MRALLLVVAVACWTLVAFSVEATLVEADHPYFGADSLTIDAEIGRCGADGAQKLIA